MTKERFYNPNEDRGATYPNWLLRREDVSGEAKLVYGRLAQYREEDGTIAPPVKTLGRECGLTAGVATAALLELREYGLIVVVSGAAEGRSNRYYLTERNDER